jgi:LVIVD repeat
VQKLRLLIACAVVLVGAVLPLTAGAVPPTVGQATATFEYTQNMHPVGYSAREVPLDNTVPGAGVFNSDLAFWGRTAIQGTYAGFRLIDVSAPASPKEIVNWTECASPTNTVGNQGDVIIWGNLVIRSWNSATPAPRYPAGHPLAGQIIPVEDPLRYTTPGAFCGDWPMFREPAAEPLPERGQEGVHIIDISDPRNPDVIGFVDTPCGSHTETLTPDLANNRLLVYSNSSAGTVFGGDPNDPTITSCAGIDIIEVPLSNPAAASYLRFEPSGDPAHPPEEHHSCHDTAVFTGDVNLVACAGSDPAGDGVNVFTTDPAQGGSLVDPKWLYFKETGGISLGHSASFTWDGEVLIVGHEPGGGSGARCEATDDPLERTFFFLDAPTGASIGQFTIPRPQTNVENCTTHNYNVVPLLNRYVMVSGNYQSGISVIDLTNPANAQEIAYADPAPLVDPNPPVGIELGGDWSSYWYNGFIYESDILRGLIIWKLSDDAVEDAIKLNRLNPQTQETSID